MPEAAPMITPLVQGSLSSRAYAALREGLMGGAFRPGQRLVMQDLADRMGTSITPVREASMRLVSEGGLQLKSGRFAMVPPMTLARYMEVRLMRLELEGLAAERAALLGSPEDLAELRRINALYAAAEAAGDSDAGHRHNREFHFAVARMSGMALLCAHIESLWVSMGPMLTVFFNHGVRLYRGATGHEAVIAAIAAHDGPAARAAFRQDIIEGGEDFIRFLEENPAYSVE